ncbi:tetratricopeptide repeat protein [Rhodovibrionaceae bacterium A322]
MAAGLLAAGLTAVPSVQAQDPRWLELPWDSRVGSEWFEELASQGDANAMYRLGQINEQGLGQPINLVEALRWYVKAAEAGHLGGQKKAAAFFHKGSVGDAGLPAAMRWYRAAADQGDGPSAYNLAFLLEQGRGADRNPQEAARYYEIAYENGVPQAALNRALLALQGQINLYEAKAWAQKAADAGVPGADDLLSQLAALSS